MKIYKRVKNSKALDVKHSDLVDLLYKNCEKLEDLKLANVKNKSEEDYYKLIVAIRNLPPHFSNCREIIFEALDNYLLSQSLIASYEHEYFYKSGFHDSRTLMLNTQKNK